MREWLTEVQHVFCFGEVLWDEFPDGRQMGGAPFNVVWHLHQWSQEATLISAIGKDKAGEDLKNAFEEMNLNTSFIQEHEVLPSGYVKVNLDQEGQPLYEIGCPVAWDDIQFEKDLPQNCVLIYGSLAARQQKSRGTLMHYLEQAAFKVLDLNLRKPYVEAHLIHELISRADCLKINEEEFVYLMHGAPPKTAKDGLRFLLEQFELKAILCTMGSKGAWYVDQQMACFEPVYPVEVVDTAGSGDAFLAAFAAASLQSCPPDEALKRAIWAGGQVASRRGATPVIHTSAYL